MIGDKSVQKESTLGALKIINEYICIYIYNYWRGCKCMKKFVAVYLIAHTILRLQPKI